MVSLSSFLACARLHVGLLLCVLVDLGWTRGKATYITSRYIARVEIQSNQAYAAICIRGRGQTPSLKGESVCLRFWLESKVGTFLFVASCSSLARSLLADHRLSFAVERFCSVQQRQLTRMRVGSLSTALLCCLSRSLVSSAGMPARPWFRT